MCSADISFEKDQLMAGSGQDTVPDFSKRLLALLDNRILHRAGGTLKLKVAFTHAFAD